MAHSSNHPTQHRSNNTFNITILVITLLLLGIGIYFIVLLETKDKKHPSPHPVYPGRCNHSAGFVWSQRLQRCIRGYRS